jgi:hypothetical protein
MAKYTPDDALPWGWSRCSLSVSVEKTMAVRIADFFIGLTRACVLAAVSPAAVLIWAADSGDSRSSSSRKLPHRSARLVRGLRRDTLALAGGVRRRLLGVPLSI